MDAIGETIENVGLAQEIQKGLAPSMQKPPKWAEFQPEIDALKTKFGGMAGWAVYSENKCNKYCIEEWGKAKGFDLSAGRRRSSAGGAGGPAKAATETGVNANWEDFKASDAFTIMCNYNALADKLDKEKVDKKMFEEVRPLGRGAFGAVFLVFKKDTGMPLATKKMFKTNAKANKMLNDLLIEREVLSKMTSPFCVNLHYAFQSDIEVSLVLSLSPGGDLAFLLQSRYSEAKKKEDRKFNALPESVVKYYAASMACGLQAIHDAGYVYRDLKPQNVLLNIDGKVKISDMGLTALVKDKAIKQCSGTRGYWSPETIKKESYQFQPDWWSLGVTIYVLTSDKMAFKGKTDEEKDAATLAGEIEFSHGESDATQKIVSALCTIDQTKRLGCNGGLSELKGHEFFAGFDWVALEDETMVAEIQPNPNDINAPSKKDIEGFKPSKDVTWDAADQDRFAAWDTFDKKLWLGTEACFRIEKKKEIAGGGGGGGGCCVIA